MALSFLSSLNVGIPPWPRKIPSLAIGGNLESKQLSKLLVKPMKDDVQGEKLLPSELRIPGGC